jgi:REP element-mobilizing transposase RayT
MRIISDIHRRRSIRLKGWDYGSLGYYFVTICTQNREPLFGDITNGNMALNEIGHIVEKCWQDIPAHFPHADLDEFIVMPNHFHGILLMKGSVGAYKHTPQRSEQSVQRGANIYSPLRMDRSDGPTLKSPSKNVGSVIRGFKIGVSQWVHKNTEIFSVWQRNYYEHIIRNKTELDQTRQYICDNPSAWPQDEENPQRKDS